MYLVSITALELFIYDMYTFLLLLRKVHIHEFVPLWCEDFDEFRSDSGNTGFAVAPASRVGVSRP
jgi:hypothetical protein